MTNDTPSLKALEAASRDWYARISTQATVHGYIEEIALALDRFAAAQVEAERAAKFLAWAVEMFGPIALERRERALRFIEEAIELAHALAIDWSTIGTIIGRVYGRDPGDPTKEAAQSLVTLEILALVLGMDLAKEADAEFARVQTISRSEWARRHAAKVAAGFAGD